MRLSVKQKFLRSACALVAFTASAMTSMPQAATAQPYGQQQSVSSSFQLGMNFLWDKGSPEKLENSFQRMKQLGIRQARTDFEWRSVEAVKGQYDWSKLDTLMQLASKYDVELLPIVQYAPEWALPADVKKPEGIYQVALTPDSYDDYARFLNAAIDRFGPGGNAPFAFKPIEYWQVWNEPNNKDFWYMKGGFLGGWDMKTAAQSFVDFMQAVNNDLGDRRNRIKIVHAGLSKNDTSYMWFLWDKDPNYGRLFDVMAVHSYFFNPSGGVRPVDAISDSDPTYTQMGFIGGPKSDHGYLKEAFNVQHFLALKKTPKPLWITEIGFMANQSGPVGKNPWVIHENQQTGLARQTLDFINSQLDIDRVYWFVLDDYGFPHDMGAFGVYRTDGSARQGLYNELDRYTP